MDILPPTISVPPSDSVRTLVAPVSAGSDPRLANSVPPSTPKPAHQIFATATLAPLPWSTTQRASSTDPGIRCEGGAPWWLLDAVPIAKPEVVLDVVLSAPGVLRVPPSPSSGSPYLELLRKLEPPQFAKDPSELPQRLAGEGLPELPPATSEHLGFPCRHTSTLFLACHLYYAPISNSVNAASDSTESVQFIFRVWRTRLWPVDK